VFNVLLIAEQNMDMHQSVLRLLNFARQATSSSAKPVQSITDLIAAMDISSARMTNWKERGVSKEGAIKAELLFGCPVSHTLDGLPISMGGTNDDKSLTNVRFAPQDRQPGLVYSWDEVIRMFRAGVEEHLPDVFSIELMDDALPGLARKGDIVTLNRRKVGTVEAGDGIMVKTANDSYMLRVYRPKGDGTWLAEATNSNFQSLHNIEDGLTILAVVVGVPSCRWSSL